MIHVIYYRNLFRVTVEGHARSDEPGKDLVCAAASTLALTLAENARALQTEGNARRVTARLESGSAEICCDAVSRFKHVTTLIFDAVCIGFDALARNYPEYIQYEIR